MGAWDWATNIIPGVNTAKRLYNSGKDLVQGDTSGAWDNLKGAGYDTATLGAYDAYGQAQDAARGIVNGVKNAANSIKDAYDAPFEQKQAGYDAISARAEQIKQERIARQQATLQQTLAAYAPTQKAISALYGDPSSWRLK